MAIPRTSAISGPVKRSRRRAATAWMRSSGVRLATQAGARRVVDQPELPLGPVAADPLARAADADFGGRGRLRHRPLLFDDPAAKQAALVQAEGGVSVKVHPVSSLGLSGLAPLSLRGGPDEPTWSGTTSIGGTIPRANKGPDHRSEKVARRSGPMHDVCNPFVQIQPPRQPDTTSNHIPLPHPVFDQALEHGRRPAGPRLGKQQVVLRAGALRPYRQGAPRAGRLTPRPRPCIAGLHSQAHRGRVLRVDRADRAAQARAVDGECLGGARTGLRPAS